MFKNSKYYLIAYLNALIHGLLSAVDNYAACKANLPFYHDTIDLMLEAA